MLELLRFLRDRSDAGSCALLAITEVIGSSSRAVGTLMAVGTDGSSIGSLSGGCVEAAIIGEAQRVMSAGKAEIIRFGQGSRFMDIRLPCGGGMDVMIVPAPESRVVRKAFDLMAARIPALLSLSLSDGVCVRPASAEARGGWDGEWFNAPLLPRLRLVIAGHGAETVALTRLAGSFGAETLALSPDEAILEAVRLAGGSGLHLQSRRVVPDFEADAHTAVVLLFHDHDWEPALLAAALAQSPFFIGAMGSRATHAQRLQRLSARGFSEAEQARIIGPIGLIPAARDPETLALSTLSQIVKRHRALLSGVAQSTEPASAGWLSRPASRTEIACTIE